MKLARLFYEPFCSLLLNKINYVFFKAGVVEAVNFLNAGWACDVHFGQIFSDDIEPDKIESVALQPWSDYAADFFISFCDIRFHTRPAYMNIAPVFICPGDAQGAAERFSVENNKTFVPLADLGNILLGNNWIAAVFGCGFKDGV